MDIAFLYDLFLKGNGVCTDTRKLAEGELYFALKGPNFDGNIFAGAALDNGASYAIVDEHPGGDDERILTVDDVLQTLQDLASHHRSQLAIPVLGITGTNGKTTNKELIHAVLSKKYNTLSTPGNFNNHIGVPLTLLSLTEEHEIAVIEMGANHIGEIRDLCSIAQPDFGLITSIGVAHLEGFGSLEGILEAKGELYDYVVENDGKCFINLNLEYVPSLFTGDPSNAIFFGDADHKPSVLSMNQSPHLEATIETATGQVDIVSRLIGSFQADNLLHALSIGQFFEVPMDDIKDALEDYKPSNNRAELKEYNGNTVILDAYNANPSSVKAALEAFLQTAQKPKMAILGDMFELGENSLMYHQEIVDLADDEAIDEVIFIGKDFSRANIPQRMYHFNTTSEAKEWWNDQKVNGYNILIKGSRGVHLEVLLED